MFRSNKDEDNISSALGYVVHVVLLISKYLEVEYLFLSFKMLGFDYFSRFPYVINCYLWGLDLSFAMR